MTGFDPAKVYGGMFYITELAVWETAAMTLAGKSIPVGEEITIGVDRDGGEVGGANAYWRYPVVDFPIADSWETKNVTLTEPTND